MPVWRKYGPVAKAKGREKAKMVEMPEMGGRGVVVVITNPLGPKLEMVLLPMPKPPPVPKPIPAPLGVGVIIPAEGAKVGALQG